MGKSLYDIMDTSDDCVADFEYACADLINAKYILAEKKIKAVLQTIAKSRNLYALISSCMRDFDFGAVLAKAKTAGASGMPILALPHERKKHIAFVFCLLLSFDTNQTDYKKFLHTFYGNDESINIEHAEFAQQVIIPFRDNVLKAYYAEADEPDFPPPVPDPATQPSSFPAFNPHGQTLPIFQQAQPPVPAQQFPVYATPAGYAQQSAGAPPVYAAQPYGQPPLYGMPQPQGYDNGQTVYETVDFVPPANRGVMDLDDLAIYTLTTSIREIIGIISRDSSIEVKDRQELLLVCEAFEQAIAMGAEKPIKTMAIALKYTLQCSPLSRQLEIQFQGLAQLIVEYNLD
jgi:hypothetical protein